MNKTANQDNRKLPTQEDVGGLGNELSTRREKKKIVRRRSGDSEESNESRRSLKISKPSDISISLKIQPKTQLQTYDSIEVTPKVKAPREQSKNLEGYTYMRLNRSTTLRKAGIELTQYKQQPDGYDCQHELCQHKVSYLEEQIKMRNQQIELIDDERLKLRKELGSYEAKLKSLQQNNHLLHEQIQKYKQDAKRLVVDKKKLESERQSLIKKIAFLQKINFSTETKNIQSYRQEHLERELLSYKEKLTKQKSQVQKMLQTELQRSKQQLFSVKKTVQALQISNLCLQRKLDEKVYFESNNDEYTTLRTKYRKFLVEFKQLRREHEKLQDQYRQLQSQLTLKTDDDLSLDLSTL